MFKKTHIMSYIGNQKKSSQPQYREFAIPGEVPRDQNAMKKLLEQFPNTVEDPLMNFHFFVNNVSGMSIENFGLAGGLWVDCKADNTTFLYSMFLKVIVELQTEKLIKFIGCELSHSKLKLNQAVVIDCELKHTYLKGHYKTLKGCDLTNSYIDYSTKIDSVINCDLKDCWWPKEVLRKVSMDCKNVPKMFSIDRYEFLSFGDGNYCIVNLDTNTAGRFRLDLGKSEMINQVGHHNTEFIQKYKRVIKLMDWKTV